MKIVTLAVFVFSHVTGGMEPDGEANDKDFTSSNANKNRISKNLENKEFNKFDVASRTHTNSAPSIVSSVGPSIKSTEVPTAMRRLSYGYIVSDCAHISCTAHYSSGFASTGPLNDTVTSIYAANDLTYSAPLMVSASSFLLSMSAGQLFLVDSSGQVLKQYSTGITNEYITPAVGSEGSIYVPGSDIVYAFSADGKTKWKSQMTGYTFQSSPTISQTGCLYIAGFNQSANIGSVTSFSTFNGAIIWNTEISASKVQSSSPVISPGDGSIYIGCLDGNIYSLSSFGSINWKFATNSTIFSTPSFDNTNNVYFGAENGCLYKLSSQGSLIWKFYTNHVILSSASISDSYNVVYISADVTPMLSTSVLYALSTTTGLQLYSVTLTGITYYSSIPAVASNDYVYINTYDPATTTGYTYCITAAGSILWNYKLNDDEYFTGPIIASDGILYTISALGTLYKFGSRNHSESSESTINPTTHPVLSNDTHSVKLHGYAVSPCPHLLCSPTYSSYFHTSGPITNDTLWSTSVSIVNSFSSPLFNSNGSIVITGSSGDILLLSAIDGAVSHHYHVHSTIFGTPAIGCNDIIYIPGNNTIFALQPNGVFKWVFSIPDPNLNIYSSITLSETGYLYVTTNRPTLNGNCPVYSISTVDGSLQWTFDDPRGSFVSSSPIIRSDGVICVGNTDKSMYAITSHGSLLWAFASGNEIYGTAAIDGDDNVYFGSTDSYVYKLNPYGSVLWQFSTLYSVVSSPSIGEDGSVFIVSSDTINARSVLYSIDGSTGDQKYSVVNSNYFSYYSSAPSVGLDNTVYVTSFDQANGDTKVQAITSSGSVQWSFSTPQDYFWSTPIIDSEGNMFVTSVRGNIYAFKPGQSTQPSFQPTNNPLSPSALPTYYPYSARSSTPPTSNHTIDSSCYCPFTQVEAIWTKDSRYPTA